MGTSAATSFELIDADGTNAAALSPIPGRAALLATIPALQAPFGEQVSVRLGADDAHAAQTFVISRASLPRVTAISLGRSQGTLQAEVAHTGALISVEVDLTVYSTLGLRLRGGVVDQVVPVVADQRTVSPALGAGLSSVYIPWDDTDEDAIAMVSVRLQDAFGRHKTFNRMMFLDSVRDAPAFDRIKLTPDPLLLGGQFGVRRQARVLGIKGDHSIDLSALIDQMTFSVPNQAIADVNVRGQARAIGEGETTLRVEIGQWSDEIPIRVSNHALSAIEVRGPPTIEARGSTAQYEAWAQYGEDADSNPLMAMLPSDLVTWGVVGDGLRISPLGKATVIEPGVCGGADGVTATFEDLPPYTLPVCPLNQAPSLRVSAPARAAPGEAVLVEAWAEDDGSIDRVELRINGALARSVPNPQAHEPTQTASFEVIAPPVAERELQLAVDAVDGDGETYRESLTISVEPARADVVSPIIEKPEQGRRLVAGLDTRLTVTAGDWLDERSPDTYRRVVFFVDEAPVGTVEQPTTDFRRRDPEVANSPVIPVSIWALGWQPPPGAVGRTVSLRVVGEGQDGSTASSRTRFVQVVRDAPPFVRIVQPQTEQIEAVRGQQLKLRTQVGDDASAQVVAELFIDGQRVDRQIVQGENGAVNQTVVLSAQIGAAQPVGRLVVRVTDAAGQSQTTARVLVPVDAPQTQITVVAPPAGYAGVPLQLQAQVEGVDGLLDWSAAWNGAVVHQGQSLPPHVFSFTPQENEGGAWTVTATLGEANASEMVDVQLDESRPVTRIRRPALGESGVEGEPLVVVFSATDSHTVEQLEYQYVVRSDLSVPVDWGNTHQVIPQRVIRPGGLIEYVHRILLNTDDAVEVLIRARAKDAVGYAAEWIERRVTIEEPPTPQARIVAPQTGRSLRRGDEVVVRVQATVGEEPAIPNLSVLYRADAEAEPAALGAVLQTSIENGWLSASFTVPNEQAIANLHSLILRSTATADGVVSDPVEEEYAVLPQQAPRIAVVRPVNGEQIRAGEIAVELAIEGQVDAAQVSLVTNPGGALNLVAPNEPTDLWTTSFQGAVGPIRLVATAGETQVEWQIDVVDDGPPTVSILAPAPQSRFNAGERISLRVHATDDHELVSVQACGEPAVPWAGGASMMLSCRVPASTPPPPAHAVEVQVVDNAGSTANATLDLQIVADGDAPQVEWIVPPPERATQGTTFRVEWQATDLVSLGAGSVVAPAGPANPVGDEIRLVRSLPNPLFPGQVSTWQARRQRFTALIDTPNIGETTVTVQTLDGAGNPGVLTQTVEVIAPENQPPTISLEPRLEDVVCVENATLQLELRVADGDLRSAKVDQTAPGEQLVWQQAWQGDDPNRVVEETLEITLPSLVGAPLGGLWLVAEASATDSAQARSTSTFHCQVQPDEPPRVVVEAPNPFTHGQNAPITVEASDAAGITLVAWARGHGFAQDGGRFSAPIDLNLAGPLSIDLDAEAGALALNIWFADGQTWFELGISDAADDDLAGLNISAADGATRVQFASGDHRIEWLVEATSQDPDRRFARLTNASPIAADWPTGDQMADVTAIALDTAGQWGSASVTRDVRVDSEGPTLTLSGPQALVRGQPFIATVMSGEPLDLINVKALEADAPGAPALAEVVVDLANHAVFANTGAWPDRVRIEATALDAFGNAGSAWIALDVREDAAPVTRFVNATNAAGRASGLQLSVGRAEVPAGLDTTIAFEIVDDVGIQTAEMHANGERFAGCGLVDEPVCTTWRQVIISAPHRPQLLVLSASDTLGQSSTARLMLEPQATLSPIVELITPVNAAIAEGARHVPVQIIVGDDIGVLPEAVTATFNGREITLETHTLGLRHAGDAGELTWARIPPSHHASRTYLHGAIELRPGEAVLNESLVLRLEATDIEGNRAVFEHALEILPDRQAPIVDFIDPSPNSGWTEGTPLEVVLRVADNVRVHAIEVSAGTALGALEPVRRVAVREADGEQTDQGHVHTVTVGLAVPPYPPPDGEAALPPFFVVATAIDVNGNRAEPVPLTLAVLRDEPPLVQLDPLMQPAVVEGQAAFISAEISDDIGVDEAILWAVASDEDCAAPLDGCMAPGGNCHTATLNAGPYAWFIEPAQVPHDRDHICVRVQARDTSGQMHHVDTELAIHEDAAPLVHIVADEAATIGQELLVRVGAWDDVGIDRVELVVERLGQAEPVELHHFIADSAPYSFRIPIPPGSPALPLQLSATAVEESGEQENQQRTATAQAQVLVQADDVSPEVSFVTPQLGAEIIERSRLEIGVHASDNVGIAYVSFQVDGQAPSIVAAPPYRLSVPVPVLADEAGREMTVEVTAVDLNNRSTTINRQVRIVADQPPENVRLIAPAQLIAGRPTTLQAAPEVRDDVGIWQVRFLAWRVGQDPESDAPQVIGRRFLRPFATDVTLDEAWIEFEGDQAPDFVMLTLAAEAVDTAGASTRSPPVVVQLRRAVPGSVEIIEPRADAAVMSGARMRVTVDVEPGGIPITAMSIVIDGEEYAYLGRPAGLPGFPNRWQREILLPAFALETQSITLMVVPYDADGVIQPGASLQLAVVPDETPPNISWISPAAHEVVTRAEPSRLTVGGVDSARIQSVEFLQNGARIATTGATRRLPSGRTGLDYDWTPSLPAGNRPTLTAVAADPAGNAADADRMVEIGLPLRDRYYPPSPQWRDAQWTALGTRSPDGSHLGFVGSSVARVQIHPLLDQAFTVGTANRLPERPTAFHALDDGRVAVTYPADPWNDSPPMLDIFELNEVGESMVAQAPGSQTVPLLGAGQAIAQAGQLLFVAQGVMGIGVFSIGPRGAPTPIMRINEHARDLAIFGQWLLIAGDGLRAVNIDTLNGNVVEGVTQTEVFSFGSTPGMASVQVSGDLAIATGLMLRADDHRYPSEAPVAVFDLRGLPEWIGLAEYDASTARLDTGTPGVIRAQLMGTQLAELHEVFDQDGRPTKALAAIQRVDRSPQGLSLRNRVRANLARPSDIALVDGQLAAIDRGALVLVGDSRIELIESTPGAETSAPDSVQQISLRFSRNVFEPSLVALDGTPRIVIRRGTLMGEAVPIRTQTDGATVEIELQAALQAGERYWVSIASGITANCGSSHAPIACQDNTSIADAHIFGFDVHADNQATIDAVDPPVGGVGSEVRIIGTGLTAGGTLTFGGIEATITAVDPAGRFLEAIAPPHGLGPVSIRYRGPQGQSAQQFGGFTYTSQLLLTRSTPPAGPVEGGNTVTLIGAGYIAQEDMQVWIGNEQATIDELTPGRLSVVAPAGVLGLVDVAVVRRPGLPDEATTILHGGYRYASSQVNTIVSRYNPVGPGRLERPADQLPRGEVGNVATDGELVWALSRARLPFNSSESELREQSRVGNAMGGVSVLDAETQTLRATKLFTPPLTPDQIVVRRDANDVGWAYISTKILPMAHLPNLVGATRSTIITLQYDQDGLVQHSVVERPGSGAGLALIDDILFAAAGVNGIEVYSLLAPAQPVLIHRIGAEAFNAESIDNIYAYGKTLVAQTDTGVRTLNWPTTSTALSILDTPQPGILRGAGSTGYLKQAGNAIRLAPDGGAPFSTDHSAGNACMNAGYAGLATYSGNPNAWISIVDVTSDDSSVHDSISVPEPIHALACEGRTIAVSLDKHGLGLHTLPYPVISRSLPAGPRVRPDQNIYLYGVECADPACSNFAVIPPGGTKSSIDDGVILTPPGNDWSANNAFEVTVSLIRAQGTPGPGFTRTWTISTDDQAQIDRVEPLAAGYAVHGKQLGGSTIELGGVALVDVAGAAQTDLRREVQAPAGVDLPYGVLTARAVDGAKVLHQRVGAVLNLEALSLVGFEPDRASRTGGHLISLRGTGFSADAQVRFDGVASADVRRLAADELLVSVPARADAGTVSVCVEQAGAPQPACLAGFEYQVAPLGRIALGGRIYDSVAAGELGILALDEGGIQLVDLSGRYRFGEFANTYIPPQRRRGLIDEDGDGQDDRIISHLALDGAVSLAWPRERHGGDLIYVGTRDGHLAVVNIEDVSAPVVRYTQRLGQAALPSLAVQGDVLVAAASELGLRHFDVQYGHLPPFEVQRDTEHPVGTSIVVQTVALIDGVRVFGTGVRDPQWHVSQGQLHFNAFALPGIDAHRIRGWRGEAIVAAGDGWLKRVNLSDGTVVTYEVDSAARDVAIAGDIAYVVTDDDGVQAVDLTAAAVAGVVSRADGVLDHHSLAGDNVNQVTITAGQVLIASTPPAGAGLDYGRDEGLRLVSASINPGEVVSPATTEVRVNFSRQVVAGQFSLTRADDLTPIALSPVSWINGSTTAKLTFDAIANNDDLGLSPGTDYILSMVDIVDTQGCPDANPCAHRLSAEWRFSTATDTSAPPLIAEVTPRYGWTTGATGVQVAGANLTGAIITFDGQPVANLVVDADGRSATFDAPPHAAGIIDITAARGGYTRRKLGGYIYLDPPSVTYARPRFFKPEGGTRLRLEGSGFLPPWQGDIQAYIGDLAHDVTVHSAFELSARVLPGTFGHAQTRLRFNIAGQALDDVAWDAGYAAEPDTLRPHQYGLATQSSVSTAHVHPIGIQVADELAYVAAGSELSGNSFDQLILEDTFPASVRVATVQRIADEDASGELRYGGLFNDTQLDEDTWQRFDALKKMPLPSPEATEEERALWSRRQRIFEQIDLQPDAFDVQVVDNNVLVAAGGSGVRVLSSQNGGLLTGNRLQPGAGLHTNRLIHDGALMLALSTSDHGYEPKLCPPVETRHGQLTWFDPRGHGLTSADPFVVRTVSWQLDLEEPSVGPVGGARDGDGVVVVEARRLGTQDCSEEAPGMSTSFNPDLRHEDKTRLVWVPDEGAPTARWMDEEHLVDVARLPGGEIILLSADRLSALAPGELPAFILDPQSAAPATLDSIALDGDLAEGLGSAQRLDIHDDLIVVSSADGSVVLLRLTLDGLEVMSAASAPHARATARLTTPTHDDLLVAGSDRVSAISLAEVGPPVAIPSPIELRAAVSQIDTPAIEVRTPPANAVIALRGASAAGADLQLSAIGIPDADGFVRFESAAAIETGGVFDLIINDQTIRGAAIVLHPLEEVAVNPPSGLMAGDFHVTLTADVPIFAPGMQVWIGDPDADGVLATGIDVLTVERLEFIAPASLTPGRRLIFVGHEGDWHEVGALSYDLRPDLRMDLPGYPPALISDMAARDVPGEASLFVTIAEQPRPDMRRGRTPSKGLEVFDILAPEAPIVVGRLPSGERPARGLVLSADAQLAFIAMGAGGNVNADTVEVVDVRDRTQPFGVETLALPSGAEAESVRRWRIDEASTLLVGLSRPSPQTGGVARTGLATPEDLDAASLWPIMDVNGNALDAFGIAPSGPNLGVLSGRRGAGNVTDFALRIYTLEDDGSGSALVHTHTVSLTETLSLTDARRARASFAGQRLYIATGNQLQSFSLTFDANGVVDDATWESGRRFPGPVTALYAKDGDAMVAFDGDFGVETVAPGAFFVNEAPTQVAQGQPLQVRFSEPIQIADPDGADLIAAAITAGALRITADGNDVPITASVQQQIGGALLQITPTNTPWPATFTLTISSGCEACIHSMTKHALDSDYVQRVNGIDAQPDFELSTPVVTAGVGVVVAVAGDALVGPLTLQVGTAAPTPLNPAGDGFETAVDLTPGVFEVRVNVNGMTSGPRMLTVLAPPHFTGISPVEGPVSGGTGVQLSGGGFRPGMAARFGNIGEVQMRPGYLGRASAVTPPSGATGPVTVSVLLEDAPVASIDPAPTFTYLDYTPDGRTQPISSMIVAETRSRVWVMTGGERDGARVQAQLWCLDLPDTLNEGVDLLEAGGLLRPDAGVQLAHAYTIGGIPLPLQQTGEWLIAATVQTGTGAIMGWPINDQLDDELGDPAWTIEAQPTAIVAQDKLVIFAEQTDACPSGNCLQVLRLTDADGHVENAGGVQIDDQGAPIQIDALHLQRDVLWIAGRENGQTVIDRRDATLGTLPRLGAPIRLAEQPDGAPAIPIELTTRTLAVSGVEVDNYRVQPRYLLLGDAEHPQILRWDLSADLAAQANRAAFIPLNAPEPPGAANTARAHQINVVGDLAWIAAGDGDLQAVRLEGPAAPEVVRQSTFFGSVHAFGYGIAGRLIGTLHVDDRGALSEPPGAGILRGSLITASTGLTPLAALPDSWDPIRPAGVMRLATNTWPGDAAFPLTACQAEDCSTPAIQLDGAAPGASFMIDAPNLDAMITVSLASNWRGAGRAALGLATTFNWQIASRRGELQPKLTHIADAAVLPGDTVTVHGEHLDHVDRVTVGDKDADDVVIIDSQTLQFVVPDSVDPACTVAVYTPGGLAARRLGALRVVGAPSALTLSPAEAPVGAQVILTGTDLLPDTTIEIAGEIQPVQWQDGALSFAAPTDVGSQTLIVSNGAVERSATIELEVLVPRHAEDDPQALANARPELVGSGDYVYAIDNNTIWQFKLLHDGADAGVSANNLGAIAANGFVIAAGDKACRVENGSFSMVGSQGVQQTVNAIGQPNWTAGAYRADGTALVLVENTEYQGEVTWYEKNQNGQWESGPVRRVGAKIASIDSATVDLDLNGDGLSEQHHAVCISAAFGRFHHYSDASTGAMLSLVSNNFALIEPDSAAEADLQPIRPESSRIHCEGWLGWTPEELVAADGLSFAANGANSAIEAVDRTENAVAVAWFETVAGVRQQRLTILRSDTGVQVEYKADIDPGAVVTGLYYAGDWLAVLTTTELFFFDTSMVPGQEQ